MTKKEMIIDILEHKNWGSQKKFENIINRTMRAKTKKQVARIYTYYLANETESDYNFVVQLLLS